MIHEENVKYDNILIQLNIRISPIWILLDNQTTVDVLSNKNLLNNVRNTNRDLAILLTGGKTTTSLVGDLPGYGTMWFHPGGI